jgi:hypothetical protein
LKRLQIHHGIFVLLTAALCAAIPLSNYVMSMMLLFITANWLIEWDFKAKWQRLKENRSILLALLFMLVFSLGFIRADDFAVALDYWVTKLPLFMAPVLFVSSQRPNHKELNFILLCFILSVLYASVFSTIFYVSHEVQDIREISVFISHIRFSLCIDVAIVLLLYYAFKEKDWSLPTLVKSFSDVQRSFRLLPKRKEFNRSVFGVVLALVSAIWLLIYLFIAQTLTGIILLFLVAVAYLLYVLFCHWKEKTYRWIAAGMLFLLAVFMVFVGSVTWRYFHVDKSQYLTIDTVTANGNPYENNMNSMVENGSPIGMYVCEEEMERAWAVRSDKDISEPVEKATLVRYLNSCHLRKDSAGVMALSDGDVHNIERGIANVDYTSGFGIKRALYPIFFSIELYRCSGDVQNSTLLQRVEYMRAAWHLVQQNWGLGVGLGNHKTAVSEQLKLEGSSMCWKERIGCHNQWLTFWLMGGIAVPVFFLIMLIYPFVEQKKKITFVYVAFFIILVGSMFTEDTLETEAGLTLFSVMNSILLYGFNLNHYENA